MPSTSGRSASTAANAASGDGNARQQRSPQGSPFSSALLGVGGAGFAAGSAGAGGGAEAGGAVAVGSLAAVLEAVFEQLGATATRAMPRARAVENRSDIRTQPIT